MAALADMSLLDETDPTPISRVFAHIEHGNGVFLWRYDNGAPIIGQPYIELRKIRDDSNSRKVRLKSVGPVMESIGSQNASGYTAAPKVAFLNTISTDFVINKRSSVQQIDDLFAFHSNAMKHVQIWNPALRGLFGY